MKRVPVGVEDFKELIDRGYYYVDKTMLIKEVMQEKVVLYTRPRRFGKTLNMSMLNYFYNIKEKENAYLFDELAISKDKEVMQHQNQYSIKKKYSVTSRDTYRMFENSERKYFYRDE